MRAADYLREKQRMCHSIQFCGECPFDRNCNLTEKTNPEKAEELVEEWATKNPRITNAMKFEEIFGESADTIWSLLLPEFNNWINKEYKSNN